MSRPAAEPRHQSRQPGVLRLCFFHNPNVGVGILPQRLLFGTQLRPRNYEDRLDSQNSRETGDNQLVRKFLAVAILVVFASLNAIDGICCPDGCTHERESTPQQRGDHAGDGSCMLCLGGIDSTGAPELTPSGMLTTRIGHRAFEIARRRARKPARPPSARIARSTIHRT